MEPIGGDLARHDHEFDEVRWIAFDEAQHAAHLRDRAALVARAAEEIASRGSALDAGSAAPAGHGGARRDRDRSTRRSTRHRCRDRHRALGARLIEFGGWLMPVQYAVDPRGAPAVRERAGLFDLSHMGELFVEGPEAGAALAAALVTDPPALAIGRAQYSMICAPDGGIIDDLIVYRLGEERFLVVANAWQRRRSCRDALADTARGLPGGPRRPLARHRPLSRSRARARSRSSRR